MNKAILISIKPKWCALIMNGEKTIEIRKTMPKCDLPIDVYIYCKKDNGKERLYPVALLDKSNQVFKRAYREYRIDNRNNYLNGKVVAKFTLNKVEEIKFNNKEIQQKACLTEDELFEYLFINIPYQEDMRKGYAWHIDNLVIFDRPKELSEFKSTKQQLLQNIELTKAPENFCYVEVE